MANAEAHVTVSGRVQGVYFRAFTEETALSLGLTGWVRNMPDGRVEAVLEGEKEVIDTAVAKLKKGPPASRVTDVTVEWAEYQGKFKSFSVRYF